MRALPAGMQFRYSLKLLKWVVLLVIGYFALRLLDMPEMRESLNALPLVTIPMFLALMLLSRILYALRWKLMASSVGIEQPSPLYMLRVGLLSEFVSIVLPSYLGGDGLRVLKLRPYSEDKGAILLSILADRVVGVLTLAALTAVFLPFVAGFAGISLPVPAPFASVGIGAALLGASALLYVLIKRTHVWTRIERLKALSLQERPLLIGVVLSLLGHLTFATAYTVLFRYLTPVDYPSIVTIVLLALLGNSIPITLFGIEMSDGVLIVLAQAIGIPPQITLVVLALVVGSRYVFSLGGLGWEMLADGREFFSAITRRKAAS